MQNCIETKVLFKDVVRNICLSCCRISLDFQGSHKCEEDTNKLKNLCCAFELNPTRDNLYKCKKCGISSPNPVISLCPKNQAYVASKKNALVSNPEEINKLMNRNKACRIRRTKHGGFGCKICFVEIPRDIVEKCFMKFAFVCTKESSDVSNLKTTIKTDIHLHWFSFEKNIFYM